MANPPLTPPEEGIHLSSALPASYILYVPIFTMGGRFCVLWILILLTVACHHNRLRISEKELTDQIIAKEKSDAEVNTLYADTTNTTGDFTPSIQYKEDRSVDPLHPPVLIDIAGNLDNVKEIKLSAIASEIKYIRMQPLPDSTIPSDFKFKYHLLDDYIVAMNLYGIHLYSKEGQYLKSIVKNEWTGLVIKQNMIAFYNDYTLKGGGMYAKSAGNILYYTYRNTMTGEEYIMNYDCSSAQITEDYKFDPENPDRISGLGNVYLDKKHGKAKPPEPKLRQGMFGGPAEWFFNNRDIFLLDNNSYAEPLYSEEAMLMIRNSKGDTLVEFSRLERLRNYTKSLKRGTDDGAQYEYKGQLHFRTEFNDTVFRVLPPDRLYPVYVLNLGNFKVTKQEGVDPDFKLNGKIIPEEWAETDKYIFLTFTKDDYDCPNNRKYKTVKIYHALFSKQNQDMTVIKGDPYDYNPEILANDIDGGVPVWPSSYMSCKNGEILVSLKGKDIKERVKSEKFRLSGASQVKKNELERFSQSLSDTDDILMIVK